MRHQGYCHLVMASMAVIMFGAMCRYDDASGLRWRNIRFVEDGSGFEITFEKRKNAQYRQEELHVFRGFNGRLVAKKYGPGKYDAGTG